MAARAGVIGCGNISGIYFENSKRFQAFDIVACADRVHERARAMAERHGQARAVTVDDLLADPAIAIVINLTTPEAHGEIAAAALDAGKAIYNEKPLALTVEDGERLLDLARRADRRVGCAPDTFLGGGLQTCRKVIDSGWIGEPVSATAFMQCHGHEHWHPDPEFYYAEGGGPMLDMGPYYLTALVSLLGPVARVSGATRKAFSERVVTSEPKRGAVIPVETPTHYAGVMEFANGAVGTIITSFDVWAHNLPRLEIHGTEGSLSLPDPNTFGGPVRVWRRDHGAWEDVPLAFGHADNSRGIGVADMAAAMRSGRPHRANGEMALHVLEVMRAFEIASSEGVCAAIKTACGAPAPFPPGLQDGETDA